MLQKSSFNLFSPFSYDEKQLMENRKWRFSIVKLQELFKRCLVFYFSYFSDLFWKNMSATKLVVQTLLFPTTKKFHWFRSQQDSLKNLDIFPETFASIINCLKIENFNHFYVISRSPDTDKFLNKKDFRQLKSDFGK